MEQKKYFSFIYENSNQYKLRVFMVTIFAACILIALFIAFGEPLYQAAKTNSIFNSLESLTRFELSELTPTNIFYTGLLGGLFFIFLPTEVLFYGSIAKGSSPVLAVFLIISGLLLAQVINYYVDSKLNPIFMHLVSKKKVYEIRRFINKYGGYGVFLANISPLPSEILTFALGITKYNVYRLFILTFIATVIKYIVIALFASMLQ